MNGKIEILKANYIIKNDIKLLHADYEKNEIKEMFNNMILSLHRYNYVFEIKFKNLYEYFDIYNLIKNDVTVENFIKNILSKSVFYNCLVYNNITLKMLLHKNFFDQTVKTKIFPKDNSISCKFSTCSLSKFINIDDLFILEADRYILIEKFLDMYNSMLAQVEVSDMQEDKKKSELTKLRLVRYYISKLKDYLYKVVIYKNFDNEYKYSIEVVKWNNSILYKVSYKSGKVILEDDNHKFEFNESSENFNIYKYIITRIILEIYHIMFSA